MFYFYSFGLSAAGRKRDREWAASIYTMYDGGPLMP